MLLTLLLTVFRVKELTLVFAPLRLPRPRPLFHGSYKCNYCSLACKQLSSGCGRTGGGGDWECLLVDFFLLRTQTFV